MPAAVQKMCGKCRQHGVIQAYKRHQNRCPFIECDCEKCHQVDDYRKRIRETVKRLKRRKSEEKKMAQDQLQNTPSTSSLHPSSNSASSSPSSAVSTCPSPSDEGLFFSDGLVNIASTQEPIKFIACKPIPLALLSGADVGMVQPCLLNECLISPSTMLEMLLQNALTNQS
ncbi:unnamed protein product [Bursaphelenchus xylophilus]|uniref:(pine wood nematode) hypothetical protein n=1 Tax=Bursaphelenchus xylophilus TaxID=6326 RepID=A0A1I7SUK1_BURXY|nr:unnamed protein product [Bursaphelenchus xylophilus]CAG9118640.1 unnamed protein product [Bursaphelenchus xylophilus]